MNGKELGLVIVGALIFGGGAGALAAQLVSSGPAPESPETQFGDRVERLENALQDARVELKRSERSRTHLEERLTKTESRLAGLQSEARVRRPDGSLASTPSQPAHPTGGVASHADPNDPAALRRRLTDEMTRKAMEHAKAFQTSGDFAEKMKQFKLAAKLRALPEDERWEKAREELFLSDGQITDLQSALAERKDLLADARKETEATLPNGKTIKTVTMDSTKMRTAETAFSERVDAVLNSDQKAAWNDKGYSQAFGARSRHSATIKTISFSTSSDGDDKGTISIGVIESDEK